MIRRSDIEYKRINSLRDSYEKRYAMLIRALLKRQFYGVANNITEGNYTDPSLAPVQDDDMMKIMKSLYSVVGVAFARDTFRNRKAEGDELIDYWAQYMMEYASTRAGRKIVSITRLTREQIRNIVGKAVDYSAAEGWGMDRTARFIRNTLKEQGEEIARWRALRIARTEVLTASNEGSLKAAKDLGVPMEKIWTAVTDQRTRDVHYMMNNVAVPLAEDFILPDGAIMDKPGDERGGPGNTINCRCGLTYRVIR